MTQRYRLDSSERDRLRRDTGELAERIATDAYSGYSRFVDAPWYDGRRDSGAVLEVKSALSTLSTGVDGRFRLWREQHEQLLEDDGEPFDPDEPLIGPGGPGWPGPEDGSNL